MKKKLINFTEDQIEALVKIQEKTGITPSEFIRRALDKSIKQELKKK